MIIFHVSQLWKAKFFNLITLWNHWLRCDTKTRLRRMSSTYNHLVKPRISSSSFRGSCRSTRRAINQYPKPQGDSLRLMRLQASRAERLTCSGGKTGKGQISPIQPFSGSDSAAAGWWNSLCVWGSQSDNFTFLTTLSTLWPSTGTPSRHRLAVVEGIIYSECFPSRSPGKIQHRSAKWSFFTSQNPMRIPELRTPLEAKAVEFGSCPDADHSILGLRSTYRQMRWFRNESALRTLPFRVFPGRR